MSADPLRPPSTEDTNAMLGQIVLPVWVCGLIWSRHPASLP
jgi:hypothetical protein